MLGWRLISASGILVVVLALLYADLVHPPARAGLQASGAWLVPLLLVLVVLASAELVSLLELDSTRPLAWTVYLGSLLTVLCSAAPIAWPLAGVPYPEPCPLGRTGWVLGGLFVALLVIVLREMRRYESPGHSLARVSLSLFAVVYTGLLSSYLAQLRLFYDHQWGMAALVSLLVVVKMSDVGAYGVGRLLGRRKIFPKLSPGKTVEGAVGGLATAAVVGWLFGRYGVPLLVASVPAASPSWIAGEWRWLVYGLIVGSFGMIGDLTISLLKRDVGRKDSGRWLPGLGGALDVADSIFMAAPPAFFCWVLGLIGPLAGT